VSSATNQMHRCTEKSALVPLPYEGAVGAGCSKE